MDRTERLLALIEILRRHRHPVTAAQLAEDLSVSIRTIYRDIRALVGLGAPIDGEAGLGYLLRPGFFLPPLMFSSDELEALVLGARWVEQQGDEPLGRAATNALAKIATASPHDLRDRIADTAFWISPGTGQLHPDPVLSLIRESIRMEHSMTIRYETEDRATSERTIWPIALAFFGDRRVVAAWCELREAFRNFRTDRIIDAEATGIRYPRRRKVLFDAYRRRNFKGGRP